MITLKFKYTNHKGDDHEYVILPTRVQFYPPGSVDGGSYQGFYCLVGETIERDGQERRVGQRSFKLVGLRDVEQTEVEILPTDEDEDEDEEEPEGL